MGADGVVGAAQVEGQKFAEAAVFLRLCDGLLSHLLALSGTHVSMLKSGSAQAASAKSWQSFEHKRAPAGPPVPPPPFEVH